MSPTYTAVPGALPDPGPALELMGGSRFFPIPFHSIRQCLLGQVIDGHSKATREKEPKGGEAWNISDFS